VAPVYVLKMPSFFQDRLGTTIRKVDLRERERAAFFSYLSLQWMWTRVATEPGCGKHHLLRHFYVKCHHFTKTDSGQTYGKLKKEWRCSQAGAYRRQGQAWLLWPTNRDDFGYDWQMVEPNAFLRYHFILKPIILPRQARDKHRESTQKTERRFPQVGYQNGLKALEYLGECGGNHLLI
jgi:hypothetical protein